MSSPQHTPNTTVDMDLMLRLAQRAQSQVLHRTPAQAAPARPTTSPKEARR